MGITKNEKMKKKGALKRKEAVYFDYSLLAVLIFLICFGLVMLYSTSSYRTACIFLCVSCSLL